MMKAAQEDESTPKQDPKRPTVWAREPDGPDEETNHPESDEGQIIEEPGYGHGV